MAPATATADPLPSTTTMTSGGASTGTARVIAGTVAVALLIVYGPTILWLFGRWTLSVWHHAHGLFIPPLVAWLIAKELRSVRHLPAVGSAWGFALLVPALVLHMLDTGMATQLLSAVSLVIALPGLSLVFLGWPRTRRILFPLVLSAFALPIPLAATERLHLALRHLTTDLVTPLLSAAGLSVFAQGTTITTSSGAVEIADACSGFSTLYASVTFAFLLAYFSRSTRRRVLVLAAAAPLAIAANTLRTFTLVVLVMLRGPEVLDTFIHPLSGMLTFAVALPVLFWLAGDTSRPSPAGQDRSGSGDARPRPAISTKFAGPVLALLAIAAVPTVIHSYSGTGVSDGRSSAAIPMDLAEEKGASTGRRAGWGEARFSSSDWIERRYGRDDVKLFVGRSVDLKRLYHHPELAVDYGENYSSSSMIRLPQRPDVPVRLLRAQNDRRRRIAMYALHYDKSFVEDPIRFQLRTSLQLLFSRRQPMTLFFAAQDVRASDAPASSRAAAVLLAAIAAFEQQKPPGGR